MEEIAENEEWIDSLFTFEPDDNQLKTPFNFHASFTPRGLKFYENVLNSDQQKDLNSLKAETARSNHVYLAEHPEIRALIALFLRSILKNAEYVKCVRKEAVKFFSRPKKDIAHEVKKYLQEREYQINKEFQVFTGQDSYSASQKSEMTSKDFSFLTYTEGPSTPDIPSIQSIECVSISSDKYEIISSILNRIIIDATKSKEISKYDEPSIKLISSSSDLSQESDFSEVSDETEYAAIINEWRMFTNIEEESNSFAISSSEEIYEENEFHAKEEFVLPKADSITIPKEESKEKNRVGFNEQSLVK